MNSKRIHTTDALPLLGTVLTSLAALSLAGPVRAEGLQIYTNVGTLGLGAGVGTRFSESLGGRLGFSTFSYNKDGTYANNDYTGKLKFLSFEALGDLWLAGPLRLTAGLVQSQNKVTLDARLPNGTVTLNGTAYPVNSASAEVDLGRSRIAPYFGVGLASRPTSDGGWGFRVDLGALRQSPVAKITVDAPAIEAQRTAFPAQYATYQANLAAEEQKLRDSVSKVRFWPVLNVGVVYSF